MNEFDILRATHYKSRYDMDAIFRSKISALIQTSSYGGDYNTYTVMRREARERLDSLAFMHEGVTFSILECLYE